MVQFGRNNWAWSDATAPATIGLLVDMRRGCVRYRLNGIDGPCVAFPLSAAWRDGVCVHIKNLPTYDFHGGHVEVTCATPPVPESLVAAADPRTISELVESGDLAAYKSQEFLAAYKSQEF